MSGTLSCVELVVASDIRLIRLLMIRCGGCCWQWLPVRNATSKSRRIVKCSRHCDCLQVKSVKCESARSVTSHDRLRLAEARPVVVAAGAAATAASCVPNDVLEVFLVSKTFGREFVRM